MVNRKIDEKKEAEEEKKAKSKYTTKKNEE